MDEARQLERIRESLSQCGVPILTWYMTSANLPKDLKASHARLFKSAPLEVDARSFGWISRQRLVWLQGPKPLDLKKIKLPHNIVALRGDSAVRLSHTGTKAIPKILRCVGGVRPRGQASRGRSREGAAHAQLHD